MSVAELGVMIPLMGIGTGMLAIWTSHKRKMTELLVRKTEAEAALGKGAGTDRTEWLEDRVKVLERIVTDKGTNLAAEIEALRDLDNAPRLTSRKDEA